MSMSPRSTAAAIATLVPMWVGAVTPLPAVRVIDAARAVIDTQLGAARSLAVVSVIGAPEELKLPAGKVEIKARVGAGAWPRSRVSVPVDVYVAGHLVSATVVWFSLSIPSSGLGYAASYTAGTDVGKLSLTPVSYDAALERTAIAELPSTGRTMRLRRGVKAGDPARSEDFEPLPDVVRGDRVQVVICSGRLRLSASATSNGDGSRGDRVSVIVEGAESAVQAEVIGKGEVQVGL